MALKYPPRSAGDLCGRGEIPRPVFGIDIDGTLAAYHEHFWAFACDYVGRLLPDVGSFHGGSFNTCLGLSKSTYRKVKLAYRRGGAKRSMPAFDGAGHLTSTLRQRGAIVVLCTTRPYLTVENIDEDTRHWAQRNRVQNDGIIWGPNKYRDLTRAYGKDRIVAVYEDEPEMIQQVKDLDLPWLASHRPYNEELNPFRYTIWEAQNRMESMLYEWEARHGEEVQAHPR